MEAADRPVFGALLQQFRLEAGITQHELAERATLSVEAISSLERGARRRPYRGTVALLARALDLSAQQCETLVASLDVATLPRRREHRDGLPEPHLRIVSPGARAEPSHNLVRHRASFVGRECELGDIAKLLRDHRLVTIVGAGGVGKSRIALEVGHKLLEDWRDGIWLVELAPLTNDELVASAVLSALRAPPSGSALDAVVAYLATRSVLLILDNCEHVVAEARNVTTTVVEACPHVRVLATSREPLNLQGERVYRLPSLAVPPESKRSTRDILTYGAATLFTHRALAADEGFILTDDHAPAIAEICRRLDGIPLAIELAAARVNVLAPAQIARRLDERFRLLTGGDSRALPRHQTMRALIDWSYDWLTPREQRFFESLSVFAGGCTLDSATAVCANDEEDDLDVVDLVASLVAKSLLVVELVGGERRYRLLESSRQYAREKLEARGEHNALARRHAQDFLGLAERLDEERDTIRAETWLAQAEPELENWRAALEWSLGARNDRETGQRLAAVLHYVFGRLSLVTEGRQWVRAGLDAVDGNTIPGVLAKLQLAQAQMDLATHRIEAALAAGKLALTLYRKVGDSIGIADAQFVLGHAFVWLGCVGEGEPLFLEALATARAAGKPSRIANVLDGLAYACQERGDVAGAREFYAEAIAIWKAAGSPGKIRVNALNLSICEFQAGEAEAALHIAREALATVETRTRERIMFFLLLYSAAYLIALGRFDEARESATEVLDLVHGSRDDPLVASTVQRFSAIAALRPYKDAESRRRGRACATQLLGFTDARLAALDAMSTRQQYTERQEYEKTLAALREEFDAEELARLMALGAAMPQDQAIDEARSIP